ncbi:MAG: PilZ domain-containing protein [Thermodesulfobacteriota bacterium]
MNFEERRQHKRHKCRGNCSLYLSRRTDTTPTSSILSGRLQDISLASAGVSLGAILLDRTHLAYAADDEKDLTLQLELPVGEEKSIVVPCRMSWYNKELDDEIFPFRLGLTFLKNVSKEELLAIKNAPRR